MPHLPDAGLARVHNDMVPGIMHPAEALTHPSPQNYGIMCEYDYNIWEAGFEPSRSRSCATVAHPPHMRNHQIRSNHQRRETDARGKRMRSDQTVEGQQSPVMTTKGEQESPASVIEALFVTSESSAASSLIPAWEARKKRKKHLDVLRRNRCWLPGQRDDSSLVRSASPSSSVGSSKNDNACADVSSSGRCPSHSESCDARSSVGGEDSAKRQHVLQVRQAETTQFQAVPDFPEVLHRVLSNSEENGSVIQWLQSGRAWRVVRWDALRRYVLPKYFVQLCQEDDGSGSIDAFLWNVRACGFEEIKAGPDAGAYTHGRFVRDEPKLLEQMQASLQCPGVETGQTFGDCQPEDVPKSPVQENSLLTVPSLATTRSDGSVEHKQPYSPEKYPPWRCHNHEDYTRPISQFYDVYQGSAHMWQYPVNMASLPENQNGHQYQPHPIVRYGVTCPSPYDPRYPFRSHPANGANSRQLTPPSSIRSGRGGARFGIDKVQANADPSRTIYPVSQRGKGPRGAGLSCRPLQPGARRPDMVRTDAPDTALTETPLVGDNSIVSTASSHRYEPLARKSKKSMLLERSLVSGFHAEG